MAREKRAKFRPSTWLCSRHLAEVAGIEAPDGRPAYAANLCPLWCGGRVVMPKRARFILHNKDGPRKRCFDIELRPPLEPVRCERQASLR
jgi:hypothetical protein